MQSPTTQHRNTLARSELLRILGANKQPPTLQELHELLRKKIPHVAFSTVYRLTRTLEQEKIVEHIDWRDRGGRYELVGPHHHHVVCGTCGIFADIDDTHVYIDIPKIARVTGFTISKHVIELEGLCKKCQ